MWSRAGAQAHSEGLRLSQRDDNVTAIALRGLAELHRRNGDFDAAFGVYETLLSRFPDSKSARDTEIQLADCYREIGDEGLRKRLTLLRVQKR